MATETQDAAATMAKGEKAPRGRSSWGEAFPVVVHQTVGFVTTPSSAMGLIHETALGLVSTKDGKAADFEFTYDGITYMVVATKDQE